VELELARQQWDDGRRRVERTRHDPPRYAHLHEQVDLVTAELRRRIGASYSLDELVDLYAGADDWAAALLHEAASPGAPQPEAALAADAAFYAYARGATDYAP
jgi:hypothetical protein